MRPASVVFAAERRRLWTGLVVVAIAVLVSGCVERRPVVLTGATMYAGPGPGARRDGDALVLTGPEEAIARLRFRTVHRWRVEVIAHPLPGPGGDWPRVQLKMPGVLPVTVVVDERRAIALDLTSEPGFADLSVALLNPGPEGTTPALRVERIEVRPFRNPG